MSNNSPELLQKTSLKCFHMEDTVYNFPTSVKIEKTQRKRPYAGMQSSDNLTLSVVSPESSSSLCKLVLNAGPSCWYQQAPTLSGKAYTLLKCQECVRTYVPKDSSLILIRIPLLLLFSSLRPLNEQDSLSCSLPHQDYEGNIRGGARKTEIGQKKYDIVKERGKPQKDGETSAQESRWGKKTIKETLSGSLQSSNKELTPEE